MSETSDLMSSLEKLRNEDLSFITKLKSVNSSDSAVNIVLQYDAQITSASQKYGVPKEMIQAIIYREQICLGYEDTVADSGVISYYTNGFGGPDSSTGIGQIFAATAIRAEQVVNRNYTLNVDNPNDIWTMWKNLQEPDYNIGNNSILTLVIARGRGLQLPW